MMDKTREKATARTHRILGIVLLCASVLSLIAILFFHPDDWPAGGYFYEIQNPLKQLGAVIAFILVNFTFGRWGSLAFPIILFFWGISIFGGKSRPWILSLKILWLGLTSGWLLHLLSITAGFGLEDYHWGFVSGRIAWALEEYTGLVGAWIITLGVILVIIEIFIGLERPLWFANFWNDLKAKYRYQREKTLARQKRLRKWERREKKAATSVVEESEAIEPVETAETPLTAGKTAISEDVYIFPSTEILTAETEIEEISDEELRASATALEKRLEEFDVEARVVAIHPGPVITRFDLQPAPGVKVNRIVALEDDLSLSMKARSLRILAPIPGEAAVGIEVPNPRSKIVNLRKVLESPAFKESKEPLTVALGVDTSGEPYVANLEEMPHLLVAGTTGSGKSVCLNAILASILYRAKPDEVRLALIDPKKLELTLYAPLLEHHLITPPGVREPVITESDDALKMLKSLELEMHIRYNKLAEYGHRSLEEYNRHREEGKLPYIVLVIDELADLMITAGGAIETPIARLAQMGRAIGIHLIVATQRPSVDVITGLIKANFPCRIAFQVATKVDSRTIIDGNGAEALLGKGDMLYLPPGKGSPVRLHGSLIDSKEVEAIVEHISRQPVFKGLMELPDPVSGEVREINLTPENKDELFEEAARLVAIHQQGSVSLLQRKLKIGYARAARLIDQLEMAGIVGPFDGSKARKVLVDESWLPEMGIKGE
jgi:S-DNA-T family DNA segregation ATPase FtsK/SpoIIIE